MSRGLRANKDSGAAQGWDMKTAERYAPNAEALRSKVRGIRVKADVLVSRVKAVLRRVQAPPDRA